MYYMWASIDRYTISNPNSVQITKVRFPTQPRCFLLFPIKQASKLVSPLFLQTNGFRGVLQTRRTTSGIQSSHTDVLSTLLSPVNTLGRGRTGQTPASRVSLGLEIRIVTLNIYDPSINKSIQLISYFSNHIFKNVSNAESIEPTINVIQSTIWNSRTRFIPSYQ